MSAAAAATPARYGSVRRHWPLIAMILFGAMAWAPLLISRPTYEPPIELESYGLGPTVFTFHSEIDGKKLTKYKDANSLLLVVRLQYGNVDRMSDTFIDISSPYTIEPRAINLVFRGSTSPARLRIDPAFSNLSIEYNAIVIPKTLSADHIKTLADVERLGGNIIATSSQTVPFLALGVQVTPSIPQPSR